MRLIVATFIAVLELTRLGKLRVRQNDAFTDIECSARDDTLPPPAPEPAADTPPPVEPLIFSPTDLSAPDTTVANVEKPLETPAEASTVTA